MEKKISVFTSVWQWVPCNLSGSNIKNFKWSLRKQGSILCCSFYYIKNMDKSFNRRVKKDLQPPNSEIALHSSDTKTVSLWRAFCDTNTQKAFWLFYYLTEPCLLLQRLLACCSSSTVTKQHATMLERMSPFNRPPQRDVSRGCPLLAKVECDEQQEQGRHGQPLRWTMAGKCF